MNAEQLSLRNEVLEDNRHTPNMLRGKDEDPPTAHEVRAALIYVRRLNRIRQRTNPSSQQ